jgi:hypothetical protein
MLKFFRKNNAHKAFRSTRTWAFRSDRVESFISTCNMLYFDVKTFIFYLIVTNKHSFIYIYSIYCLYKVKLKDLYFE